MTTKKDEAIKDEETKEVSIPDNGTGNSIAKADSSAIRFNAADLDVPIEDVPDLDNAEIIPFDLTDDYWTPEKVGETKRLFFDSIDVVEYADANTGEVKSLKTAFFYEKRKSETGDEMVRVSNASARMVGRLEDHMQKGTIARGTPLIIVYKGKEKNKTNANMSDTWGIKPLMLQIPVKG